MVSPDAVPTVTKEGTTLHFTVASYNEYEVDTNCDWITTEPVRAISPQIAAYTFTVPANEGRGRSTRITFTGKAGTASTEVTVTQEGVKLIPDKEGATIKGEVTCESIPMEGVVVSDGFEVTTTDKDGCYWLASKKKNGSVFISIPGGYMVDTDGSIPSFWQATTAAPNVVEEHSFSLRREPNTQHILLATTDPHMANRYNYNKTYTDTPQYRNDFRGDIDAFRQGARHEERLRHLPRRPHVGHLLVRQGHALHARKLPQGDREFPGALFPGHGQPRLRHEVHR